MDEADGEYEEHELDKILRERPLERHSDSDGDSFHGDEEKAKRRRLKIGAELHRRLSIHDNPLSSEATPQTYVLDRGLDLPPDTERPNRWTGPPKSYRNVIEGERGLYESMKAARSRDLAAHLYNAHAIRNKAKRHSESMSNEEGPETIYLPKRWVAWPLPSAMVPRVDEAAHRQLDLYTLRMAPDIRPSAELEDTIMARMMKTAKERFMAREWDDDEVRTSRAYSPSNPDDMKDSNDDKKDEEATAIQELRPVVQADDGVSQHQLLPLSRNVISQLDQVLTGLHHSMKNRYHSDTTSDESATSDTEEEAPRSGSRRKNGKEGQSRGRKRMRKSSRTPDMPSGRRAMSTLSSTGPDTENECMHSRSHSRGLSRNSHDDGRSINHKLALRDWSEVMGLAAMTGLPSAAVMRASKRCADLFSQDMEFRTFGETKIKKVTRGEFRSWKYAYVESDSDPDAEVQAAPRKRGRPRATSSSRAQPQSRQPRPRSVAAPVPLHPHTPLPTSSNAEAIDSRSDPDENQDATHEQQYPPRSGVGKGAHRKADIICPVVKCRRHTEGFSRVWNLNLHLKRVHPQLSERQRSRSQSRPSGDLIEID